MDRQKDFDKDINVRSKIIEEMAKVIDDCCWRESCLTCEYYDEELQGYKSRAMKFAEALYNAGYSKIPEKAVVLTDEEDIKQFEWSKLIDKMGVFRTIDKECAKVRKETAEKFAEMGKKHRSIKGLSQIDGLEAVYRYICEGLDEIAKQITEDKV